MGSMEGVPPPEGYCAWLDGERALEVGIVGTGPGFNTVLDLIARDEFHDFLPAMRLTAVSEPGQAVEDGRKVERARSMGASVHASWGDMIRSHAGIDIVVELTGSRPLLADLRQALPGHVTLIDHAAAVFLCGLHNMTLMRSHCRADLDRHRAMLAAIVDEVREDILLLDRNMRVVDANRNIWERFGSGRGDVAGRPCWEVQGLDPDQDFCPPGNPDCPFHVTMRTGQKAEGLQTRINREGRLQYFRVYTYPVLDTDGRVGHVLVMRRDITRRTMLEKGAQQAEKLAAIGEMSTFLAHEIRNPLFAIAGFANSLKRSSHLDEAEREKLTIIIEETERLDRMLRSILDFARTPAGSAGEVDVGRVVRDTVELMRIGYAPQGVSMDMSLDESLPRAKGDPELLKQCLVNLIKNSIEAMPGGGTISIRARFAEGRVLVEVEDTGLGMPRHLVEKVFSPFFTTKDKGYGLGLAMIKKIIEEAGGSVELASVEGRGTNVTLRLAPVLEGEGTQTGQAAPPLPGGSA